MKAVNLLPERPKGSRSVVGGRRPLVALGAAAVIASAGWWGWSSTQDADAVRQDVGAATAERDALQSRLGLYQASDARLAAVKARRGEVARLTAGRTNWERLIRDLAAVTPRTISLTNLKAEHGAAQASATAGAAPAGGAVGTPTGINLGGFAPDQRTVALLMARAASVRGLGEPYLTASEVDAGSSLPIRFVIDIPVDQRAQDRPVLTPVAATGTEATP